MEPWHNDYVLSDHQAAEIIAQDVPDLTVSGACYFAEGWDFTVFAIDTAATTWLFRFPKRKECARRLEAEYKVVDQLVPALVDTGIRVPDFHYRIEKSKAFALPYGGYELLEGGKQGVLINDHDKRNGDSALRSEHAADVTRHLGRRPPQVPANESTYILGNYAQKNIQGRGGKCILNCLEMKV